MSRYEFKQVELDEVKENKKNARKHTPEQISELSRLITEYGFTNPLLVDEKMRLIAGHGRCMAAKALGLTTVPAVVITGLSNKQIRALGIADNKIALNAYWDEELLYSELKGIGKLELTGFTIAEFEGLYQDRDFETDEGEEKGNRKSHKTDDGYSAFEIVMQYENKLKFVSLINKIKLAKSLDTSEEAIMVLVDGYGHN